MKDTVRLNFEFPMSEYPYLKLMCVEKGISFRDFATKLLRNMNSDDNIPFEKVKELSSDPRPEGHKKLHGRSSPPLYRVRAGDYRINLLSF